MDETNGIERKRKCSTAQICCITLFIICIVLAMLHWNQLRSFLLIYTNEIQSWGMLGMVGIALLYLPSATIGVPPGMCEYSYVFLQPFLNAKKMKKQ